MYIKNFETRHSTVIPEITNDRSQRYLSGLFANSIEHSFTHVLHGGISGDLLELAAHHLRSRRGARLLALPAPDTDSADYNQCHQSDDADQQG